MHLKTLSVTSTRLNLLKLMMEDGFGELNWEELKTFLNKFLGSVTRNNTIYYRGVVNGKSISKFIDKKDFFFQLGQKDGQDGKYRSREEISMLPDVGQISEDDFQEYLSGREVGEEDSYYYEDLYELDEDNLLNFLNEEEEQLDEKRKKRKKKKKKSKGKKDACYHKVRARYDVWPSAYASGALVKCRKVGAANWGNKSKKKNEGLELDDYLLQVIQEEYASSACRKKKRRRRALSRVKNPI